MASAWNPEAIRMKAVCGVSVCEEGGGELNVLTKDALPLERQTGIDKGLDVDAMTVQDMVRRITIVPRAPDVNGTVADQRLELRGRRNLVDEYVQAGTVGVFACCRAFSKRIRVMWRAVSTASDKT
jgi:hypothetical protein